jgi:hypothetical protein
VDITTESLIFKSPYIYRSNLPLLPVRQDKLDLSCPRFSGR